MQLSKNSNHTSKTNLIQSVPKTKIRKTMKSCFSKNKKCKHKSSKSKAADFLTHSHMPVKTKKKSHHRSISDSHNLMDFTYNFSIPYAQPSSSIHIADRSIPN